MLDPPGPSTTGGGTGARAPSQTPATMKTTAVNLHTWTSSGAPSAAASRQGPSGVRVPGETACVVGNPIQMRLSAPVRMDQRDPPVVLRVGDLRTVGRPLRGERVGSA